MEEPTSEVRLYDDDVLAWAEQQAAALRSLASRHDLPNELALTNVIEEIEDVGKSEFHAVESLIENILADIAMGRFGRAGDARLDIGNHRVEWCSAAQD